MKKTVQFIFITSFIIIAGCKGKDQNKLVPSIPTRSVSGVHESKGSLSFKLDGQLYEADPAHAKAWMLTQMPLAMLMARNDKGLSVSWQMNHITGQGKYRIDGDNKGNVNFTVNGKTYWTKSVMKDDYLDIEITDTKQLATMLLLSGTFEGVLEDRDGNKVKITEGCFTTESL